MKRAATLLPPKSEQDEKLSKANTNDKVYWLGGRPRRLPGATVTGCVIST